MKGDGRIRQPPLPVRQNRTQRQPSAENAHKAQSIIVRVTVICPVSLQVTHQNQRRRIVVFVLMEFAIDQVRYRCCRVTAVSRQQSNPPHGIARGAKAFN
jgi:hypothetical protein